MLSNKKLGVFLSEKESPYKLLQMDSRENSFSMLFNAYKADITDTVREN